MNDVPYIVLKKDKCESLKRGYELLIKNLQEELADSAQKFQQLQEDLEIAHRHQQATEVELAQLR
ncbi:hypothetical protein DPMN_147536 [Dreissena polymorpha]|uniref:Uncharacterized protein n=1 Tax=Dreissena polymorpha TaxID=45954 RepID=A0A9D4F973_DREPO|nr:hypothetical protein DPMN_147536 [Dreissena polymorpha]